MITVKKTGVIGLKHSTNKKFEHTKENYIRYFDAQISDVPDILKFTMGEPDFDVPDLVKEAAIEAIEGNYSHYAPTAGIPELRKEIVAYIKRHYDLDYDADKQILVTIGVTEALCVAANALLNPGEKVVIPAPYFSLYDNIIKTAHGVPVYVDTSMDGFVCSAEKLDEILTKEENVKYVLLNYPSNPMGVSYKEEELEALAQVIKKHQVYCVADEVYADLTYEGFKHTSIAKFIPEQTIVLNGLSKSFAMTGMRVGYMAIPEDIYQSFYVVHQSTVTCVPTPIQMAAVAALREGDAEMEKMRKAYEERRNYIIPELEKLGFKIAPPVGAFYLFLKIPENQNQEDKAFALELAKKAKVGLTPGSAFGQGGAGYLRLSYAASLESLKEVVKRLNDYLLV